MALSSDAVRQEIPVHPGENSKHRLRSFWTGKPAITDQEWAPVVEAKSDKNPFRSKVRRRLIRAIAQLHPDVEVVRARAWRGTEPQAGARWIADERSLGKGTHDAFLIIIKRGP